MEQAISQDILRHILQSLMPILDKRVLVLFTGGSADSGSLLDAMESLLASRAKIAVSPAFARLAPEPFLQRIEDRLVQNEEEMRLFLTDAHLTVVPVLTRNTLVKSALGIQDTVVTNAIAVTLMRGIPLIAINENYHPHSSHSKGKGYSANPGYNAMLLEYERILASLGATLVEGAEFASSVKGALYPGIFTSPPKAASVAESWKFSGGKVVTRADIPALPQGTTVVLPAMSVITPLAMEQIERQKLIVLRA